MLAGHETTANSLAWIFERLLRAPAAYGRLRELTRGADDDSRHGGRVIVQRKLG